MRGEGGAEMGEREWEGEEGAVQSESPVSPLLTRSHAKAFCTLRYTLYESPTLAKKNSRKLEIFEWKSLTI